jgi:hypothetical protein
VQALGCERDVKVSLVGWHALVTSRRASLRSQLVTGPRGVFCQFFAISTGIAGGGEDLGAEFGVAGGPTRSKTRTASRATCGARWA